MTCCRWTRFGYNQEHKVNMTNEQIFFSVFFLAIMVWGYIRTAITNKRVAFDSPSDAGWSFVPVVGGFVVMSAFDSTLSLIEMGAELGEWWWTIGATVVGLLVTWWGWVKTKQNTIRANYRMSWGELHYLVIFKIMSSTVAAVLGMVMFSKMMDKETTISEKIAPVLAILMLLIVFFVPLFNGDAVRAEGNAPREEN